MVLIFEEEPGLGARFAQGIGKGLSGESPNNSVAQFGQMMQQKQLQEKQARDLAQADQFLEQNYGIRLSGIKDPRMRELVVGKALEAQKKGKDQEIDEERAKTIGKYFGEEAEEIYRVASEGGKTSFLDRLLEGKERGINLDEKISPYFEEPEEKISPEISLEPEKPKRKHIDFDKGLTPKERVKRQEDRYGKNLPLYQESQHRLQALEAERNGLDIMADLSPKISGLDKLNINPRSGELIIPGLASVDAQRYVKTVNDFTTKAKDSFGARVTNFDLVQFLKRLPTLANTEEGRRQITEQMQIINDINMLYEQTLQDVIDDYGGIRNIDYDQAQKLAEKEFKPKMEKLKKKFFKIDSGANKILDKNIEEFKRKTPKGQIPIREADGTLGWIDAKDKKVFLEHDPGNEIL